MLLVFVRIFLFIFCHVNKHPMLLLFFVSFIVCFVCYRLTVNTAVHI